jgi:hypothetical protein
MYPFFWRNALPMSVPASILSRNVVCLSIISLAFSLSIDLSRSSAAFRHYNTIFHWRDRFLLILFWSEILLRLGVVSWPHLLALCVEGCCCMYDVKSVFPECMYATIFLLFVISVPQVGHLLSPTTLFLENLFGVIARSILSDRFWCEILRPLSSYRGRIC